MSNVDHELTIIAALSSLPDQVPLVVLNLLTQLYRSRLGAIPGDHTLAYKTWQRVLDDITETRKAREIIERGLE